MFTSTVGKTFLKAYNRYFGSNYSAERFFYDEFIPLFFDHEKYMMTAGNSPLENPKIKWEKMIKGEIPFESFNIRQDRIRKMAYRINNDPVDASFAIGYPTHDESTGTSGQITTIEIEHTRENIFLSWIGSALSIGIQGGMSILFNDPQILLDVYSGWKYYREYLDTYPKLRGNQINTWNGNWLSHHYNKRMYDKDHPLYGFPELSTSQKGLLEFNTVSWTEVILRISLQRRGYNYIGYIYNIGQTNTTIGFIPFQLPQLRKPFELYQKIFGEGSYRKDEAKIIKLFGGEIGFRQACQNGAIGIEALEPKGLKQYMPGYRNKTKMPDYNKTDEDRVITFNTYKIWVVAMLNNEELWEKSYKIAEILVDYTAGAGKAKTDRTNSVRSFLESSTKRMFIENFSPIFENTIDPQLGYEIAEIVNKMSSDDVKYLITLIRFQYAGLSKR